MDGTNEGIIVTDIQIKVRPKQTLSILVDVKSSLDLLLFHCPMLNKSNAIHNASFATQRQLLLLKL